MGFCYIEEIPLYLPGAPYDELGSARLSDGALHIKPGDNASVAYDPEGFIDLVCKVGLRRLEESHIKSLMTKGDAGIYIGKRNGEMDWGNGLVLRRVKEKA